MKGMHSTEKKIARSAKRLRTVVFMLMLGGALMPQSAHAIMLPYFVFDTQAQQLQQTEASDIATALSEASQLVQTANEKWDKQIKLWKDEFKKYTDETKKVGSAIVKDLENYSKLVVELGDSIRDNQTVNKRLQAQLDHAYQNHMTKASSEYICNNMKAYSGPSHLKVFARTLSEQLTRGFAQAYRSSTSDGKGPQKHADLQRLKCGEYGTGGDGPKTGSKVSGHECVADDDDFSDLDISAEALDFEHVYTVPEKEQKGEAWAYKNDGNKSTRMWLAVRNYCYNFAGSRPSPYYGKNIRSDTDGQDLDYATCLARQNAFAKVCFDRLAKISRPSKKDEDTKTYYEIGKEACLAAKNAGVTLPKNVDCELGVSLYQAEKLTHDLCSSEENALQEAKGGVTTAASMKNKLWCQLSFDKWKKRLQEEEEAFNQAVLGMHAVDSCWRSLK